MPGKSTRVYFLALLLGSIFLAAQLHFCVDLNPKSMDSHVCPICSTVGTAIAIPALVMAVVPAIIPLEVLSVMAAIPVVVLRNMAPRAPPLA
jgi:hypothetical protein